LAAKGQKAKKTFVLDTSVLLADPGALYRFAEHEVIMNSTTPIFQPCLMASFAMAPMIQESWRSRKT